MIPGLERTLLTSPILILIPLLLYIFQRGVRERSNSFDIEAQRHVLPYVNIKNVHTSKFVQ